MRLSLAELLRGEFVEAAASARAALSGETRRDLRRLAHRKVDCFPRSLERLLASLLPKVGRQVCPVLACSRRGAAPRAFDAATRPEMAPVTGWGYYRVGQDGRLYFLAKSEHYHAPLGHSFPGYRLIEHAQRLGIPNATHNNTRGHVTRVLEEELVRTANGLGRGDRVGLDAALRSGRAGRLNRVLNLQTGSLAFEAGIKMMLARFYRVHPRDGRPRHSGRTPVLLVVGDEGGSLRANYHGTTLAAQAMRGMWPEMRSLAEAGRLLKVAALRPNDVAELESAFRAHHRGRYRIAGFCHELVLMNYGALRLTQRFCRRAYALCREHDVPTLADEIQSCMWSPELYLVREYGLRPTFLVIGKGFPGGQYAASRVLFESRVDCLPQFGALVTNGQEELASLAYLITMRWAEANAEATRAVGERYWAGLRELADRYPRHVAGLHGLRHLAAVHFRRIESARAFVGALVDGGIDISVQTYKADCPPAALTKLPLIAGTQAVDMLLGRMDEAMRRL